MGPFAGQVASVCVMGAEGFDGNNRDGNEEPCPDGKDVRQRDHA